ncbi:MAG TPA: acyl-CoA thioesterase [Candidatus Paceibacterota bacterium]|nr:acyl-CoA thioesterase [Verrucomicrobiota bacterium]HRY50958.1 acyl-CoA thioesterase [Candidatus Paceibacterota bacterium]HSA03230.1 acyl-CoA thioesterase [Candidatus Paceibacterota bacterium]
MRDLPQTKSPQASAVETRYIVMPQHANDYGIAFGGTIMAWIDMIAAMVAQRHCECEVVTVSTDKITFLAPIQIGEHVVLKGCVNYVGRTSMEVGVQVTRENPYTGESVRATTAYLTFVGIDRNKHPTPIPALLPQTPDERRRFENARLRMESRKELLRKLKPPTLTSDPLTT